MTPIKQFDTAWTWSIPFSLPNSPSLTGATATLVFVNRATGARVERDADIPDPQVPVVIYQPVDEDVAIAGTFDLELHFTFSDGKKLAAPTLDYMQLEIIPAL